MKYRVEIAPSAEEEIEAAYRYIRADSPINAERWRQGLCEVIEQLDLFPDGCGLAPENRRVDFEVRQTFYGAYRVLFTILDDRVVILHFRHSARRFLTRSQITRPQP